MAAADPPPAFPWETAMAFGLGRLRLPSEAFWRLTPRELAAAMGAFGGGNSRDAPPARTTLDALMQQFPDG